MSTSENVGNEGLQSRNLARGILSSLGARVITLVSPLVLLPLTYRDFGPVQFSAWATVLSLTSLFLWADLGLGNGLLTQLSQALAIGDLLTAQRLISAAYSLLMLVACSMFAILVLATGILKWDHLLGLQEATHVDELVMICLGTFIMSAPVGLIQRVQYALGEVSSSNFFVASGAITALVAGLIAIYCGFSFLVVVSILSSGSFAGSLMATLRTYVRHPLLRPRLINPLTPVGRSLVSLGLVFLFVQLCSSTAMNVDNVIAAHVAKASDLGSFTATLRVFLVLGAVIGVATLPLWPANAAALGRGDYAWVRRTTFRMSALTAAAVVSVGLILTFGGNSLLGLLLGAAFHADTTLMLGLTALWAAVGATSPLFMVQNSQGYLKPQVIVWPIFLALTVVVKFQVGEHVGLSCIPWVSFGTYLLVVAPAAVFGYKKCLSREMRVM